MANLAEEFKALLCRQEISSFSSEAGRFVKGQRLRSDVKDVLPAMWRDLCHPAFGSRLLVATLIDGFQSDCLLTFIFGQKRDAIAFGPCGATDRCQTLLTKYEMPCGGEYVVVNCKCGLHVGLAQQRFSCCVKYHAPRDFRRHSVQTDDALSAFAMSHNLRCSTANCLNLRRA